MSKWYGPGAEDNAGVSMVHSVMDARCGAASHLPSPASPSSQNHQIMSEQHRIINCIGIDIILDTDIRPVRVANLTTDTRSPALLRPDVMPGDLPSPESCISISPQSPRRYIPFQGKKVSRSFRSSLPQLAKDAVHLHHPRTTV